MIERSRADGDKVAVVNLKNLAWVLGATKNVLFVLESHSTGMKHFVFIKVEIGRQLAHRADKLGCVAL